MHLAFRTLIITTVLALVSGVFIAIPAAPSVPWQSKVDPWVFQTAAESETEFLVFLTEQADLSQALTLKTKQEKGTYVFETLREIAARTQPGVTTALKARGADYRAYWVANMIWVRGGASLVQAMAERSDVAHVYANPRVKPDLPEAISSSDQPASTEAIEWNINWVNAPEVWAAGFTGEGVVVAGQDTGYDWDHPALINQYRGWNGATADHNYNWHDAIHEDDPHTSPGNPCGFDSQIPCDDQSHGTHTMGTIVGDDGGANKIGMAPGARWIGCRNMEEGWGKPSTYFECYQWFIAPTDLSGNNPDPSKAPHVINNSWSCPDSEGCTDANVLLTVVENVVSAGILTIHSAGNEGSSCSTVSTPAAIYDASFTVGATGYLTDEIAGFSSRGPVTVDGSNRTKPDVSAPGSNIRSSTPGDDYGVSSGTSMAGPHVTGLVALLISAAPGLAGQVNTLESVIGQTAVHISSDACDQEDTTFPNNTYGWGRIDAFAATDSIDQAFEVTKTASAETVIPGDILTYTLTANNPFTSLPINNAIITDSIPAGTTFITATQPYSRSGDTITWFTPVLAPMGIWTAQLMVRAPVTFVGSVENAHYSAKSDEFEAVVGPPVVTDIHALDFGKTASVETVSLGDRITYTLQLTNVHPISVTHNLVVTDTLPIGTSIISATLPFTQAGDLVKWTVESLDPGETITVTLAVEVFREAKEVIVNESYYVTSDEVTLPIYGEPVVTPVDSRAYYPQIFKGASTD